MTDYGSDISVFPDLDASFALRTGPHVVGEAVARRLITARGSLFYDPQYGFDTRMILNDAVPASRLGVIAAQIESEALKDERVQACSATLTQNVQAGTLRIQVLLTLASGPFQFVLTIGQAAGQQTLVFGK